MTSLWKTSLLVAISILMLAGCTHRGRIAIRGDSGDLSDVHEKCPDISGTYHDVASEVFDGETSIEGVCEMHLLPYGNYLSYKDYDCSLDFVLHRRFSTRSGEKKEFMDTSELDWKVVIQQENNGEIIANVFDEDKYLRKHILNPNDYWCDNNQIILAYENILIANDKASFHLTKDGSLIFRRVATSFVGAIPYVIIFPAYFHTDQRFKWERIGE